MSEVLLIFPDTGIPGRPERPPLGVLTVAAPLVSRGINVRILDQRIEDSFKDKLLAELKENLLFVGISSMSGKQIKYALETASIVRQNSSVPIVWGGVQATLEPISTAAHPLVDIAVVGDGEEAICELYDFLKSKASISSIKGLAYKDNGTVVFTGEREPADIGKLPLIPFELVSFDKYAPEPKTRDLTWMKKPPFILPIETSRGCPFSCIFCTESVRKKKWRALEPERVVKDIESYIEDLGAMNFTFIDDNLFGNIRRGEKLVKLLAERNFGIKWYTNIRSDYLSKVDSSFFKILEQAGCGMLTFGAESGSNSILKMINKKASVNDIIQVNRKLLPSSIIPHFVTIRGFPTESKEDIKQTYMLLAKLALENPKSQLDSPFLIPTPSTKIAEICLKGKTTNYTLDDWSNILELFKDDKPEWVLDDTWKFINSHGGFMPALTAATSQNKILKMTGRVLLMAFIAGFKCGFSSYVSSLVQFLKRIKSLRI